MYKNFKLLFIIITTPAEQVRCTIMKEMLDGKIKERSKKGQERLSLQWEKHTAELFPGKP